MIIKSIFKGSFGQSIVEVMLIVIGVLIALGVDEWRSEVADKKATQRHLVGIVTEVNTNRWSLHNIRDRVLPVQIAELEKVIRLLDQPAPNIDDPEEFIETLIRSSGNSSPWFMQNSFDSLKTSEQYHSPYIQGIVRHISAAFEATSILFRERFDHSDAYSDTVSRLVPARFQSENNEMAGHAPAKYSAPVIADNQPTDKAIATILDNRTQLVQLARYKAERITAKWYAMTRILLEFQDLRDEIINHPLMQGIEVQVPEWQANLEDARI
jgi:hypothetical protein